MATVDIELYYDLDRRRWTTSAGGLATQPSLFIGQSNTIDFKVRFVQGGVPIELTNPSFIAGVKVTDDPLGDYLLLTTTGTKTGTGATTIYTFTLNIDSVELQAYLVGITPTTNSTAFEVRDTVNNIATLPAITCSILPDYTLTGATPAAASGTLVVDSGATFTVHKTFAMPVDDGFNNYVLKTNGSGVGSWAADNAGTGTVTSVGLSVAGGGTVLSITGTPVTSSGTLGIIVAGTSGGLLYFSSGNTMGSTATLGLGALVVGGGAVGVPTALAAVASGRVLTSAGTLTNPAYSSTITLGASGTLGTITLGNATSGTILITPPTGALGTVTLTLPITSTTLAGLAVAQTFSANQTFSGTINIAATTSTAGQITQGGERFIHTFQPSGQNQNVFIGFQAGRTSTMTGGGNVGIGRAALQGLTSGGNNLAFGDAAAYQLSSGSSNVIIGQNSGNNLTTGSQNSACGIGSLKSLISGSSNSAFGYGALESNTGSNSVGVGFNSGNSSTGNNNIFVGHTAGFATAAVGGLGGLAITSGTNNTMLGQASSSTSATGTYRTAIGSDSRCQSDNAIKLGRDYSATNAGDITILAQIPTANLPAASASNKGAIVFVSDDGNGHVYFSDGISWARIKN